MKIPWKGPLRVVLTAVALPVFLFALIPLSIVWLLVLMVMVLSFMFDIVIYGWDEAVVRFKRDDLPFLQSLMPWGW